MAKNLFIEFRRTVSYGVLLLVSLIYLYFFHSFSYLFASIILAGFELYNKTLVIDRNRINVLRWFGVLFVLGLFDYYFRNIGFHIQLVFCSVWLAIYVLPRVFSSREGTNKCLVIYTCKNDLQFGRYLNTINKVIGYISTIDAPGFLDAKPVVKFSEYIGEKLICIVLDKSWDSLSFDYKRKLRSKFDIRVYSTSKLSDLGSEINYNDVLGRQQINISVSSNNNLRDKSILVTGAAGSIGSVLSLQLSHFEYKSLILVDKSESDVFKLRQQLIDRDYDLSRVQFHIIDIAIDSEINLLLDSVDELNVIFHAAAYKHVDLMQVSSKQLFRNNILGTRNILDLARLKAVENFVLISTDKAVNPTNFMGMSKRLCEYMVNDFGEANDSIRCAITRFGNVLGSNGSVVPIFMKQIKEGRPITLTDENITRYFMTIPEAASLILETLNFPQRNSVYVFDMGNPIKILDLAKSLISMYGDGDEEIRITGLRPGEKMYEELFYDSTKLVTTSNSKIMISPKEFSTFIGQEFRKSMEHALKNYQLWNNEDFSFWWSNLIKINGSIEK